MCPSRKPFDFNGRLIFGYGTESSPPPPPPPPFLSPSPSIVLPSLSRSCLLCQDILAATE